MRIFQNNEMRIRAHTFISTITVETLKSALVSMTMKPSLVAKRESR